MGPRIIVIDDDRDYLEVMQGRLLAAGFPGVELEDDPRRAASRFEAEEFFDIALIDMTMPEISGLALLEIIKNHNPGTECIMVTAVNDARTATQCLRKGAYDYLVKPVAPEDLAMSLGRTLERKRLRDILTIEKSRDLPQLSNPALFAPIITRSHPVLRVLKEAELHAGSDVPVLITGESGTGKELLARAIHAASPRAAQAFTPVNMASLSAGLFEAEFFGHTRGAFTGAEKERAGFLKQTHRGTMFLDEIGNMPLEIQGKLLRVLQDGQYAKLGTSAPQKVDVRFIAATNENLEEMMSRRMFRKDLYYRISGGWLHLPPLRKRKEDIPLLAGHFLTEYCAPGPPCGIEDAALCVLMEYGFPGNIRELRSIVQSAVNLAQGQSISLHCLPDHLHKAGAVAACTRASQADVDMPLAEVEKKHILQVYRHLQRNKSQTARRLGIGMNTLRRKLKAYDEM
ncbi:MAG: sigma-54 dependent transcriptional regulator [Desulfobacterales bacterium]